MREFSYNFHSLICEMKRRHLDFYYRHLHETKVYDLDNLRLGETARNLLPPLIKEFTQIIVGSMEAFNELFPRLSFYEFPTYMKKYQMEDLMRSTYLWKKYLDGCITVREKLIGWQVILEGASREIVSDNILRGEIREYFDNGYDSIVPVPHKLTLESICSPQSLVHRHLLWCFKKDYPEDFNPSKGVFQIDDGIWVEDIETGIEFELYPIPDKNIINNLYSTNQLILKL